MESSFNPIKDFGQVKIPVARTISLPITLGEGSQATTNVRKNISSQICGCFLIFTSMPEISKRIQNLLCLRVSTSIKNMLHDHS